MSSHQISHQTKICPHNHRTTQNTHIHTQSRPPTPTPPNTTTLLGWKTCRLCSCSQVMCCIPATELLQKTLIQNHWRVFVCLYQDWTNTGLRPELRLHLRTELHHVLLHSHRDFSWVRTAQGLCGGRVFSWWDSEIWLRFCPDRGNALNVPQTYKLWTHHLRLRTACTDWKYKTSIKRRKCQ